MAIHKRKLMTAEMASHFSHLRRAHREDSCKETVDERGKVHIHTYECVILEEHLIIIPNTTTPPNCLIRITVKIRE